MELEGRSAVVTGGAGRLGAAAVEQLAAAGVGVAGFDRDGDRAAFPKRMGRPEGFALLVESIVRNPYPNGENIRLDGARRFPPK